MARLHGFACVPRPSSNVYRFYAVAAVVALLVAPSRAGGASEGKEVVPFVVLMQMRVGSTWFMTTHLQQHPDIAAEQEICGRSEEEPGSCGRRVREFQQRCAKSAARSARNRSWCGFKGKVGRLQKDFDVLLKPEATTSGIHFQSYRFVHLYRSNIVKQAVSLAIASSTGTWGCSGGGECDKNPRLRLTAATIMKNVKFLLEETAATCRLLRNVPPAMVLEVAYEDLLTSEVATVHMVYDFLGVGRWSNWTHARHRQSDAENPFKLLSMGEQDRLRLSLRAKYPGLNLDMLMDGDDGSLYSGACSAEASHSLVV